MTYKIAKRSGFTIVELMIATSVFSMVLLVVTAGVIGFTRQYNKGIINSRTQNVARDVIDELTQGLQFTAGGSTIASISTNGSSGTTWGLCLGGKPYYIENLKKIQQNGTLTATTTRHAFVTANQSCSMAVPNIREMTSSQLKAIGGRELLGENMRFLALNIGAADSTGQSILVDVRIAYGDDDLLCTPATNGGSWTPNSGFACASTFQYTGWSPNAHCRTGAGSEYCSVVGLSNIVSARL